MTESDQQIVRAVRRGDRDAFGRLVRSYQSRLFGLAMMMARDRAAAEEITQDAFVRAYTHLHAYDEQRPFYPWLAAIGVRLAQNWLQRHHRIERREGVSIDSIPEPGKAPVDPAVLLADERNRRLWSEVQSLSSGERTAVLLYYRDELAVGDIARALGVTAGTVKTLLFRARRHLRARLESTGININITQETEP